MNNKLTIIICAVLCLTACSKPKNNYFDNFPKEADPVEVGTKLTRRFLNQGHSQYGSPLRINEPRTQVTYPDVCTWLGGLWFAKESGSEELTQGLIGRFEPLFTTEAYLQPKPNHVDNNVFGAVPLEIYMQTGEERYKTLGMYYADTQWELPANWDLSGQEQRKSSMYGDFADADLYLPEQKEWADRGYSWQTRFWMDDMYMITTVQAQAYRVTHERKYIDRAAREMVLYLDSIQQPSGLFFHAPTAPFCWGRGNGWMAAGMADLLRTLPEDNKDRPAIMKGYLKMMNTLKETQAPSGMWRQVVDDPTMWEETSGTAMFTYAMIIGVKRGWLDGETYGPAARKAWIALCGYVNDDGDVETVCEGTMLGDNSEHYRNRKALTGDLHGIAPVLWCAYELLAEPVSSFYLENTLAKERTDEAIVLNRVQMNPVDDLVPLVTDLSGNPVPCQLDDLNGDEIWDQLAFVYSFRPLEKARMKIQWIKKEDYPVFTPRTNIRYGKMTSPGVVEELRTDSHGKYNLPRDPDTYPYQMDGPAWENDKMGFRHYFDGRNSRDVFGKRVPDMVLDTVGIRADGTPGDTYHVLAEWGRDIMSAGNSFGLGGLALLTPDSLVRMGVPAGWKEDVIDSTRFRIITEGPVRSIFRLEYDGWEVKGTKINLKEEVTIWAGKYGYENRVSTTALPDDSYLVTGIVANFNDMPFTEKQHDSKLLSILTHDKQSYNKEYYLGMGLILPMENVVETFHAPEADADIIKTWCVKMKPAPGNEYRFNVYAAWELGDPAFENRDAFVALMDDYAEEINHPVIIRF